MTPPLAAWGLVGDVRPLPGGHRNTVLRIGDHVLKTTRRTEAALEWLSAAQIVAARCGLSAPRLMRSTSGALKVEGWTCEPFFDGQETPPSHIVAQVTAFHAASAHLPQRPGFASARDLLNCLSSGDVDLTVVPSGLARRLRQAWSTLPARQCVVHGDLNPSNILRDAQGAVILLDWDEARKDAPLFDLGALSEPARQAWEVACCWQVEPDRARHLARMFAG